MQLEKIIFLISLAISTFVLGEIWPFLNLLFGNICVFIFLFIKKGIYITRSKSFIRCTCFSITW
jgi:hypothetical protein